MSYELSFAEDFFTGDADGIGELPLTELYPVTKKPRSVMQALVSMEKLMPSYFRLMVKEVLGYSLSKGQPVDESVHWDLLERVRQYNTCDTLTASITVYVNDTYSVVIYDNKK